MSDAVALVDELAPHGRCAVCKRPLPKARRKPWKTCPPKPAEEKSACSRVESRFSEIKTGLDNLFEGLDGNDEDTRRYLQYAKSRLWSELNTITNRGRLVGTLVADETGQMVASPPYTKKRSGWWRDQSPKLTRAELAALEAPLAPVPCPYCARDLALRGVVPSRFARKHFIRDPHKPAQRTICPGTGMRVDFDWINELPTE